jgi:adenosylhomocysteine nucleosidase
MPSLNHFDVLLLARGHRAHFNGRPMEDKKIAVCFALAEEAGAFEKVCGDKVHVFLTGIGRENAERAAREFLSAHRPSLLMTCGFAGGLIPELEIGDVIFEIPTNGGAGNDSYAAIRSKLAAAGTRAAKIYCADRIATTAADKKKLREETGADAAEMESGAVQAVCCAEAIPCVTVRVISDTAEQDLPLDFNKFLKEDKSVDMSKLMVAVAKAPWKMGALMELQKNTKLAAQRLADVLVKVIE